MMNRIEAIELRCSQCLYSAFVIQDVDKFVCDLSYFADNLAYEGGVFRFYKTPPVVRPERVAGITNITSLFGNGSLH